ncbi:MAG: hypothetical protein JWP97_2104 [Labilithrix sp.]|nr:hypothetical protein [Labilithrix sp.]
MREPLDTAVAIETPEHTVFAYRIAGPARRGVALLLDTLVCYGAVLLLALVVYLAFMTGRSLETLSSEAKAGQGLVLLALFAVEWLYFFLFEGLTGRSLGKRALGLRVVTTKGRPIGWRAAALRNLLRAADRLPLGYVVGFASMTMTSRFQRLGDLVAGTMVVVPEVSRRAATIELEPPAAPRELASLPEHVTLDADEREAIELFLRRRPSLGRAREHELADMIAGPVGRRLGVSHPDPSRLLALVYDRAVNRGRADAAPPSWDPRARREERPWS